MSEPAVPPELEALVQVGERFEQTVCWSEEDIRRFATLAGDTNPLHHDADYAAAHPLGGLIASGTQTVSAVMGAFASGLTRPDAHPRRDALGMQFTFTLKAPLRAGETLHITWEVVSRTYKPRHRGWVVNARGRACNASGVVLEAEGTGLVKVAPPLENP